MKLKESFSQSGVKSTSAEIYGEVLKENDSDLKNKNVLVNLMLTISPSTAACERGFSWMNRQKTKGLSKLSGDALEDIMRINIDGPKF